MVEENLSGLLTLGNRRGALLRWSLLGCCKWENDYRLNAFIFVFLPVVFERSISNSAALNSELPLNAGLCACVGTSSLLENDSAFSIRTSSILGQTSRRFWNARQTGREYTQQNRRCFGSSSTTLFNTHFTRIPAESSKPGRSRPLEHPPLVWRVLFTSFVRFGPLVFQSPKIIYFFLPLSHQLFELGLFAFASVLRATTRK